MSNWSTMGGLFPTKKTPKVIVMQAPTESDVVRVCQALESTDLLESYLILVLRPGLEIESSEDFIARAEEHANDLRKKTEKQVGFYVG